MHQKVAELEVEAQEHVYIYCCLPFFHLISSVVRTLSKLPGDRKCFRLVGDVLVERTVNEVVPALEQNKAAVYEICVLTIHVLDLTND